MRTTHNENITLSKEQRITLWKEQQITPVEGTASSSQVGGVNQWVSQNVSEGNVETAKQRETRVGVQAKVEAESSSRGSYE